MAGRPKKKIAYPHGLWEGAPVKVSNPNDFKGFKLGLILGMCKDQGIIVWLTKSSTPGFRVDTCIHTERGHTIEVITNDDPRKDDEGRD